MSAIDKEGQPFDDPAARRALHDAIRSGAARRSRSCELDLHINDPEFADAAARKLLELMSVRRLESTTDAPESRLDTQSIRDLVTPAQLS